MIEPVDVKQYLVAQHGLLGLPPTAPGETAVIVSKVLPDGRVIQRFGFLSLKHEPDCTCSAELDLVAALRGAIDVIEEELP